MKLIEVVFPKGSPVSAPVRPEVEFALLLDPKNSPRNVFVRAEKNQVVAAASYRLFDIPVPGQKKALRIAGVGLVVTDPAYQRKGLGHKIQEEIERRAQSEGALISVLWSDMVQFYTRLGYVVAGTEMQWQLDKNDLSVLRNRLKAEVPDKNSGVELVALRDFSEALRSLYKHNGSGPLRDWARYEVLLSLPDTFGYAAMNHVTKQIQAYALMGKGRDLRDTVHELIGANSSIKFLIKKLSTHASSGLRVHLPPGSALQNEISHWLGTQPTKSALAFFKVLRGSDFANWMSGLKDFLPNGVSVANLPGDKGFVMRSQLVTFFESSDYGHLLQLFLGPYAVHELEGLPGNLTQHLSSMTRSLPLYFWGFDSV